MSNVFCNNCGQPTGGAQYCPHCGAAQNNYSGGTGELGFIVLAILGILLFVLPVVLFNPLSTYWFLIRKRYFPSISETGRKVAFWTSWLYAGAMLLLFIMGQLEPSLFVPETAKWLQTVTFGAVFIVPFPFLWSIIKGPFSHHQIKRGIIHIILVLVFTHLAIISMFVLMKINEYVDKDKIEREQPVHIINQIKPNAHQFDFIRVNKSVG